MVFTSKVYNSEKIVPGLPKELYKYKIEAESFYLVLDNSKISMKIFFDFKHSLINYEELRNMFYFYGILLSDESIEIGVKQKNEQYPIGLLRMGKGAQHGILNHKLGQLSYYDFIQAIYRMYQSFDIPTYIMLDLDLLATQLSKIHEIHLLLKFTAVQDNFIDKTQIAYN